MRSRKVKNIVNTALVLALAGALALGSLVANTDSQKCARTKEDKTSLYRCLDYDEWFAYYGIPYDEIKKYSEGMKYEKGLYNMSFRKAYYGWSKYQTNQVVWDYFSYPGAHDEDITAFLNSWEKLWNISFEEANWMAFSWAMNGALSSDGIKRFLDAGFMVNHIKFLQDQGFLEKSYKYTGNKEAKGIIYAWDGNYKKLFTEHGPRTFKINANTNSFAPIKYQSSNKAVATVDKKGNVTMKKPGTTTITMKIAASKPYTAATKKIKVKVVRADDEDLDLTLKATDNAIKLSWDKKKISKGGPARKYLIYRNDGSGWEKYTTVKDKETFEDVNVEPGTKYEYKVRYYLVTGEAKYHNIHYFVTPTYSDSVWCKVSSTNENADVLDDTLYQ